MCGKASFSQLDSSIFALRYCIFIILHFKIFLSKEEPCIKYNISGKYYQNQIDGNTFAILFYPAISIKIIYFSICQTNSPNDNKMRRNRQNFSTDCVNNEIYIYIYIGTIICFIALRTFFIFEDLLLLRLSMRLVYSLTSGIIL